MKKQYRITPDQTVLVLGGRGFIGRHVTKHLKKLGANVVIGSRQFDLKKQNKPPTRHVALHKIKTTADWDKILSGIQIIINTVGILRQRRGETYEHIHNHALQSLSEACVERNIRLIHISALGLENPIKSRFATSKLRGENTVKNSSANWVIVRPSLVNGEGGYGAKWFQMVSKWPIHFVPSNAVGVFSPIDANDLGEAIARIALKKEEESNNYKRIYELGSNQNVNVIDYLRLLRPTNTPALVIKIPAILSKVVSHLFDLIHFSPYSFGHYEILKFDNRPSINRLEEVLGRPAAIICPKNIANDYKPALPTYS